MNVYVNNGSQGSSSRTPKPKAAPASSTAVPQISAPSSDIVASDPSPIEQEVKNPPRYVDSCISINRRIHVRLTKIKETMLSCILLNMHVLESLTFNLDWT